LVEAAGIEPANVQIRGFNFRHLEALSGAQTHTRLTNDQIGEMTQARQLE